MITATGCSPQFLPGVYWRAQRSFVVFVVFEVGESFEARVIEYPRVVHDAKSCYHIMGISYEGDEKGLLDFLTLVDEGRNQEVLVCAS